ncbi:hypothetical protein O1611_g7358 [Lasiodiplodia mahajangana]|uniref:Uncharacterized protein n=1 Tax=Lasiodiplodia mahajangana TaxID=1108764 RepID=A0ACC2JFT6_9PEZI|nr:hypothetical protein O1611_g7358 [Lasiodiplodia mahajangana]
MTMTSHGNNGYDSNVAGSAALRGGVAALNYEDSDLNSITRSQMNQDLIAYRYDLEFCQTQLTTQPDLSPQEIRTLQIRILDCGHNILAPTAPGGTAAPTGKYKRQRVRKSEGGEFDVTGNNNGDLAEADMAASPGAPTNSFQRLGYWDCRLCRSRKYLEAGSNRVPSAPCKWPLKDISKMINHFLDLHTEHTPRERCSELGDALARNRGPFEYWLTRTKGQDIENNEMIDEYVRMLQEGSLPDAMRGLLRAATMFPNTVSNSYKK